MLPQELFDEIVERVPEHDHKTLRACWASSRALAATARPRCFRSVHVDMSGLQSARLLNLLSAQPEIGGLVHALYLVVGSPHSEIVSWASLGHELQATASGGETDILSALVSYLVNIRHFSFAAPLDWNDVPATFRTTLAGMTPQLETLYLRRIYVDVASAQLWKDFQQTYSAARNLKRLSLCIYSYSPLVALPLPLDFAARLESLAFCDYASSSLAKGLLSSSGLGRLRTLSLGYPEVSQVKNLLARLPADNIIEELNIWCIHAGRAIITEPFGFIFFPHTVWSPVCDALRKCRTSLKLELVLPSLRWHHDDHDDSNMHSGPASCFARAKVLRSIMLAFGVEDRAHIRDEFTARHLGIVEEDRRPYWSDPGP
uniref:F-box domain-containing protein n=1 Tax=Mycena chlorophos TaxID=658473 RepID=A0ABQ0MAS1_MYCCL|nr:predicted protein [Mycena chlorophos]